MVQQIFRASMIDTQQVNGPTRSHGSAIQWLLTLLYNAKRAQITVSRVSYLFISPSLRCPYSFMSSINIKDYMEIDYLVDTGQFWVLTQLQLRFATDGARSYILLLRETVMPQLHLILGKNGEGMRCTYVHILDMAEVQIANGTPAITSWLSFLKNEPVN